MTMDGFNPFCSSIFNVMPFLFTTHPDGLKSQAVLLPECPLINVCLCTSAPSDSSTSDENEELALQVQEFSANHQLCHRMPLFYTTTGQPRLVQEVAKGLVGHFLFCRGSNVVIRIVETEAYEEREAVYRYRFPGPPPDFKSRAGYLVSCRIAFGQKLMLITAGDATSGDVVLLRACNAVYGEDEIANRVNLGQPRTQDKLTNMMSGPAKVARALAPYLRRQSYRNLLHVSPGLQLLRKDPTPLVMFGGMRMLPDNLSRNYYRMNRAGRSFRFACATRQKLQLKSFLDRIDANQP